MSFGDLLAKTQRDIETIGWTTIGVFPGEGDEPTPPFSYSIGFQEHEHPELIVVGLSPNVAHFIIAAFYERVAAGEKFKDGELVEDILDDDYIVKMQALPPDGVPLNMARRYYGTDELPALQVVWPDREGHFPGDEHFNPEYDDVQNLEKIRSEA